MGGTRNTGSVRLPPLTGVLFGGAGQQVSEAQPLFVTLPGRGRYAVPVKHVPKVIMFTGLRERLALQLLKLAGGPFTGTLLHELEGLEAQDHGGAACLDPARQCRGSRRPCRRAGAGRVAGTGVRDRAGGCAAAGAAPEKACTDVRRRGLRR